MACVIGESTKIRRLHDLSSSEAAKCGIVCAAHTFPARLSPKERADWNRTATYLASSLTAAITVTVTVRPERTARRNTSARETSVTETRRGGEGVWMDLPNPKQTRSTPGSYLSDQTFVFTTRLIKRLPSLYCFRGRGRLAGLVAGRERNPRGRGRMFCRSWVCLRLPADTNDDSCVEYGVLGRQIYRMRALDRAT